MPSLVSLRIYDLPLLAREFEEDELPRRLFFVQLKKE
jgi:hypothetical protein